MLLYELIFWVQRPMHGRRERERQQACLFLLGMLWFILLSSI